MAAKIETILSIARKFNLIFNLFFNLNLYSFADMERYDSKYNFANMKVGDKERIKVRKSERDKTLYKLRSAISYQKKEYGTDWKAWADESGVHYERIEPKESILNEEREKV